MGLTIRTRKKFQSRKQQIGNLPANTDLTQKSCFRQVGERKKRKETGGGLHAEGAQRNQNAIGDGTATAKKKSIERPLLRVQSRGATGEHQFRIKQKGFRKLLDGDHRRNQINNARKNC